MLHQMVLLQASPNYRLSTSSVMNLLTCDDAGKYSLTSDLSLTEIPPYAILSHTWELDEVTFADIGSYRLKWQQKVDYQKIRFCAEQARRNGLHYFWVGTCCIDKSNAIELQTAINSMFRWYRDAERCYVYMADVSHASASNEQEIAPWRTPFQKSKWFSRGWTLQELIAPKVVEFYSKEGTFLGDKQSLEYIIRDITGIPPKALRGTPLSEFTVTERESWARNRQTKYEEDMAYAFLGIFSVFLPLIYGEGRDEAQRRLREEVQKAVKGPPNNDFAITFSLSEAPEIQNFVARKEELAEMRRTLISDGSRRVVVLHGLGGIGKTQLAVTYLKQYRDEYSAIFWP
ncbi:Vegetative incompatibility protein HET-E-1 [Beauveria bassiana]|uniref:Vegetative incompatibility protein HET-E-1 n=1 Tax=Beauveria bassiana TaxID=176275 RepID=A0A2N6N7V6_BEABA|nr:Vegetative incompatibility protein HET-E-1 [Beauveria bassiana]